MDSFLNFLRLFTMSSCRKRTETCENCIASCSDKYLRRLGLPPKSSEIALQNDENKTVRKIHQGDLSNIIQDFNLKKLPKYVTDPGQDKVTCSKCKNIVRKVRSLLNEITYIRNNERLETCRYCKKTDIKCKRCEFIVNNFLLYNYEKLQNCLKIWVCKINNFLQDILNDKSLCSNTIRKYVKFRGSCSKIELEILFKELTTHLSMNEGEFTALPVTESCALVERMSEIKNMLEEVVKKVKYEVYYDPKSSLSSSQASIFCIYKYFAQKKIEVDNVVKDMVLTDKSLKNKDFEITHESIKKQKKILTNRSVTGTKDSFLLDKTMQKHKQRIVKSKEVKLEIDRSTVKNYVKSKAKLSSEEALCLKLMTEKKTKNKREKSNQTQKVIPIKQVTSLPELVELKSLEKNEVISDSIVECNDAGLDSPNEIIKGTKIVPYEKDKNHSKNNEDKLNPILFHSHANIEDPDLLCQTPNLSMVSVKKERTLNDNSCGIIKYRLSEESFIEKGWTQLPSLKTVRKMNIYKMIPKSNDNWFERQNKVFTFYESGEKFSEMFKDGNGRWFYRNGALALAYYKELNSSQWYVVFNSGKADQYGKARCISVLACFDYLGNGVVYDHSGNERLKYNQSEGQIIDGKIGPPFKWKWHSLNDPPVFQTTLIENYEKSNLRHINNLFLHERQNNSEVPRNQRNEEMTIVEHQNYVKKTNKKLKRKFTPFQIKMKALKVNDYFSLRIIDQMHIYLIFRDGKTSNKLNVGMILQSNEILNTDITCVTCVGTPYESFPPKSRSIANIQQMIAKTKKLNAPKMCSVVYK